MAFITIYLFLLQSILLMGISVADPLIDASPSKITLGTTSVLDINCTFSLDNHPDMAAFISLVLSRANATGQNFEELAAITEFSPNSVNILTQNNASATGVHSQTGESFLSLTWQYPTALQAGTYKCSAHGVDNIGHNVELTNTSLVTLDEANLNDIFEKLRQMEMQESSMSNTISTLKNQMQTLENDKTSMENQIQTLLNEKASLENQIQTMQNDKTSMKSQIQNLQNDKASMEHDIQTLQTDKISMALNIQNLEKDISHLESTVPLLQKVANWIPLGKHQDHYYYVSTENYGDVDNAISACISFGGELAVMNNQDEYTAVKGFLGYTSGFSYVVIAGSDEDTEGKWVLPGSNTPLPFTAWTSFSLSGNNETWNCLQLDSRYSWLMNGVVCHSAPTDGFRYMCELSNV